MCLEQEMYKMEKQKPLKTTRIVSKEHKKHFYETI